MAAYGNWCSSLGILWIVNYADLVSRTPGGLPEFFDVGIEVYLYY